MFKKKAPAWDPYGVVHTCKISGVKNLKTYFYRVGSKTQKEWSGVKTFTAQHIHPHITKVSESAKSNLGLTAELFNSHYQLAISGDLGSYPDTSQFVVDVLSKRKDLGAYVTCGDLAYAGQNTKRNDPWGIMNQKVLGKREAEAEEAHLCLLCVSSSNSSDSCLRKS